jgi:hypothetical protein
MKILATVLLASLVCQAGLRSNSQKHVSKTWVPAVYHGLVMGKSTRAAVLRVLGKPTWVGRESDTGIPMMNFTVADPLPGNLSVFFERGILDGMTLYPKGTVTKEDIVRVFGSDYVIGRYERDECFDDSGAASIYESPTGSVKYMEYRKRGLVISFYRDEVDGIMFVERLSVPAHSRCQGQRKKHPDQP